MDQLRVMPNDLTWPTAWMSSWKRYACCWLGRVAMSVPSDRPPGPRLSSEVADAMSFGRWAMRYFEPKSDAKSCAERLADSALALRRSIYTRILAGPFGELNLDEIKPVALGELLDRVKTERGPGPAVHARELVLQVYRFADPLRQTKACHQSMPTGLESEAVEGM